MTDDMDRDENVERELGRRLRDVLAGEAASVHPARDGLARIRERIHAQGARRGWARPLTAVGAAAATAAVAVVVVVAVAPGSSNHDQPVGPLSSTSSTSTPSSPSATSSAPSDPGADGKTNNIAIFYVGKAKDPQQLLYREIVTRPYPADKSFIQTAVNAMLTTSPTDSDYVSYWPSGTTVRGVSVHDTEAIVDLSAEADNAAPDALDMGAISAQQLFYTVNAAAPKIDSVELRIDGKPVSELWGSRITNPITADPTWQAWAHVWITSPSDGATVPSTFTFGGEATTFEMNVSWQILINGEVIKQGAVTADPGSMAPSDGPTPGTWRQTVTLGTPGTYELRAFETSAKDGSPTYVDTKTIIVK